MLKLGGHAREEAGGVPGSFFASTVPGMETVLAKELAAPAIGALDVLPKSGGVLFRGSHDTVMRAVMWSRVALRVMERLSHAEGIIRTPAQLYDFARESCPWDRIMDKSSTLKVTALLSRPSPDMSHSHFCALTVKNAVTDHFLERHGERPSVSLEDPDVPLFLSIHEESASIYRIWSGVSSLHKRGYRAESVIHKAALRESTAAGLLMMSGYDIQQEINDDSLMRLCDPMCGSGTLAIEAALIACGTAPGLIGLNPLKFQGGNTYPFLNWPDISKRAWDSVVQSAELKDKRKKIDRTFIFCNDVSVSSITLAKQGAEAAGVDHLISFSNCDIKDYKLPQSTQFVIVNPPWGERLDGPTFEAAWSVLGEWAKKSARNETSDNSISTVSSPIIAHESSHSTSHQAINSTNVSQNAFDLWVISGNPNATRLLRLRASERHTVESGGTKLKLLKYEMK